MLATRQKAKHRCQQMCNESIQHDGYVAYMTHWNRPLVAIRCSSLQGDGQQTLAYDMMHCTPEKTISSYDEHVCSTIFRALVENHCFNMSEGNFDSFWRDAE